MMTSKDVSYLPSEDSDSSSQEKKSHTVPSTGLSQDVDMVTLTSGASTPSKRLTPQKKKKKPFGIKRKQNRTSFATPRKLFPSKRYRTITPEDSGETPSADSPTSSQAPPSADTATSSQAPESPVSSASKKLGTAFSYFEERVTCQITVRDPQLKEQMVSVSEVRSNLVIDSGVLQRVLSNCAICKICKRGDLKLWDKGTKSGLGNYLTLRCGACGRGEDFWTVSGKFGKKIDIGGKLVTKRNDSVFQSVLAGRLIGVGRKGLSIYHAMLGLAKPSIDFNLIQVDLLVAVELVAKQSMDRAALELETLHGRCENGLIHDIASFDGAYQKRSTKGGGGYSRYCFASVISMKLGKIVAFDVACNSCRECTRFANMLEDQGLDKEEYDKLVVSHQPHCPAKYSAYSSVCLESELSTVLLEQALTRGICFDGLVCDGDNKTFAKVTDKNPYADLAPLHKIQRYECLAHVGKRMKGHLIDHQKDLLKQARSDKKTERSKLITLGGDERSVKRQLDTQFKGKLVRKTKPRGDWGEESVEVKFLSDEMCSRITSFYQLAVKQHLGNSAEILEAVKAIPLHLGANDENASENHSFCPKGPDSWCRYERALSSGDIPPRHPNYLGHNAVGLITKVFSKYNYDKEYFINQIADGQTSNHNEAVHNIIFTMVRKTEAVGLVVMRLGCALAVIRYNEGYQAISEVLDLLHVKIHPGIREIFANLDKVRVEHSYKLELKQRKRFSSRIKRNRKNIASIRRFGKGYESGKSSASHLGSPDEEVVAAAKNPGVPTSSQDGDKCVVCGRGENDGIIESLNIIVNNDVLEWISCGICNLWFHNLCVGLDESEDYSDVDWSCAACEKP